MTPDQEKLAEHYARRVALAKMSEEEAIEHMRLEWKTTQAWAKSDSEKVGSFRWFCDLFDLEPSAVRRAIREKR